MKKPAAKGPRVPKKLFGLGAVIADGFHRTPFHGLFALGLFLGGLGLFVNVGVAAVIVAGVVVWGRLAAEIAIDALIIDVILAGDVFGISIRDVSHKNRNFELSLGFER